MRGLSPRCTLVTAVAVAIFGIATSVANAQEAMRFDLPAQPLAKSLNAVARQTNTNLLFDLRLIEGKMAPALSGQLTPQAAITQLLDGSGFGLEVVNEHTIVLTPVGVKKISLSEQSDTRSAGDNGGDNVKLDSASSENRPESAGGSILQEVIVTANRREESLSKVPSSVAALSQDTLDNLGAKDITDIVRFTPGLTTINQGNAVSITIRGIGSSAGAATTGIYLDDTPIQARALTTASQALPKTFDLERVEVLRGPQGTLFGAGSQGGTVRYIMTEPSLTTFSTRARSEISFIEGGAPSYEAGIAAGGPIVTDSLGVRASVWYRRDGGWIDLVDPTTLASANRNNNYGETTAARIAAKWSPNAVISVEPSFAYQVRKLHDVSTYWDTLSDADSNRFVSGALSTSPEDDTYSLGALKFTASLDSAEIIANTSYFRRKDHSSYDGTLAFLGFYQTLGWPPFGIPFAGSACPTHESCYPFVDGSGIHLPAELQDYRIQALLQVEQEAFTQEVRMQSADPDAFMTWTVGVFYSTQRSIFVESDIDPDADRFANAVFGTSLCGAFGLPCNADGSTPLAGSNIYIAQLQGRDQQLAGFGEAVWALTDRLKLTTGLRYSKVDFRATSFADGPINFGASYSAGKQEEKPLTERVSLAFQQDSSNLYYATFATGFRPGGVNAPIPASACQDDFDAFGIDGAPSSYRSDKVKSYELGAKNYIGGRIKLASSVYYVQWDDIQQSVTLPTCQFLYTANLGAAVSRGADVELEWAIVDDLDLTAAIGYTSAKYTKNVLPGPNATTPVISNGNAIVSGQGSFSAPPSPWTVSVGLQKAFDAFGHESFARLDYQYASRNDTAFAATDPRTVQYDPYIGPTPSYSFVSFRAGTSFNDITVAFFVDNLFNTDTVTSINHTRLDGSGPQPPASPLYGFTTFRPRTFGLTFSYKN